jgi:hypothetical protein
VRLAGSLVLVAGTIILAAGCGGKSSSTPEIVKFDGPSSVSCAKSGETKTVSFQYEAKNAETVNPEVDGNPVGAQAGYDPNSGTMNFPYVCPGPHTLMIFATGKNNKNASESKRVVPSSGGGAVGTPQIVKFEGQKVVTSCGKKGQVKTLSFQYETKNATSVEPEIDGNPVGAQAGYNPHSGTMRFPYVCPGPHKLTISAFGKGRKTVSKTVTVQPEALG